MQVYTRAFKVNYMVIYQSHEMFGELLSQMNVGSRLLYQVSTLRGMEAGEFSLLGFRDAYARYRICVDSSAPRSAVHAASDSAK
jgi:hypothetical protein